MKIKALIAVFAFCLIVLLWKQNNFYSDVFESGLRNRYFKSFMDFLNEQTVKIKSDFDNGEISNVEDGFEKEEMNENKNKTLTSKEDIEYIENNIFINSKNFIPMWRKVQNHRLKTLKEMCQKFNPYINMDTGNQ